MGRDFQTFPGGKGANQAVAVQRAGGVQTHLLAALGNDTFAAPIEQSLRDSRITLHAVRLADQPTGTAFICVADDAENAITVAPGANAALAPEHLPPLQGFSHLLLPLESPLATVTAYAQAAKTQGVCVVLNAAPAQPLPKDLLDALDVLVVNQGELATLSNHTGSIAQCLERMTTPTVVVTLGRHGCCARSNGAFFLQPGFEVTPVDTTAAGDTFCGVLVAALSQGCNMGQSLRLASAAGALACTRWGAQTSIPRADEVVAFLSAQPASTENALAQLRTLCGLA